jgi:hypothetical protein
MANIDGTNGLVGTGLFNTKIPDLSDAADIQAALRLYHYGSETYNGANTNPDNLEPESIANHLQTLSERITVRENLGLGSEYSATLPTTPVEGYVWVDSNSTATITQVVSTASYQTTAPANGLTQGMLWVDSDSSPLKMYVYSGTAWLEIGA